MADKYKITLIQRLADETEAELSVWANNFSEGKTDKLEELTNTQLNLIFKALTELKVDQLTRMRKKIIHLLCLYGMTNVAGAPDMKRIQEFVQKIGSRNPSKKNLYRLNKVECRNVLNQIDTMVKKTIHKQ